MNNPLNRYPKFRQALLDIQFVVSGVVVLVGAFFAATDYDLPAWYVGVVAALSALWSYLGFTAARNVDTTPPAEYDPRDEEPDLPVE